MQAVGSIGTALLSNVITTQRDCCECSTEDVILMVAVAGAVAAVAATLFAGQMVAAVGFGLFGAVSLWMLIDDGESVERIQQMADAMTQTKRQLDASVAKESQLTAELKQQEQLFKQNRHGMEKQLAQYRQVNDENEVSQQRWGKEREALQKENGLLQQRIGQLGKSLQELEKNYLKVTEQVKRFLESTGSLERSAAAIEKTVPQLHQEGARLHDATEILDRRFDEDFAQLSAGLDKQLHFFEQYKKQIAEKDYEIAKVNEILNKKIALHKETNAQIERVKQAKEELAKERQEDQATIERLQKLKSDLVKQLTELSMQIKESKSELSDLVRRI